MIDKNKCQKPNGKSIINKKTKMNTAYFLCLAALILLVATSFILPQLTLMLQDKKSMETAHYMSRTVPDYSGIDTDYEKHISARMENFARGYSENRQYYVTGTEQLTEPEEIYDLSQQLWNQEMEFFIPYTYAGSLQLLLSDYYGIASIKTKKSFVIYDDSGEGVSFLCWYYYIEAGEDFGLHLVVDKEDYTVYYAEIIGQEKLPKGDIKMEIISDDVAYMNMEKYGYYCLDYYGGSKKATEYYEIGGAEAVDGAEDYAAEEAEKIYQENRESLEVLETCEIPIYYDGGTLHFEVSYTDGDYIIPSVRLGIREIIDLLPEEVTVHNFG